MIKKSKVVAILLTFVPCLVMIGFFELQQYLEVSGFLNKRDLGFVGGESGSLYEYLTNVWHWDVFSGFLFLLTLFGFLTGIFLLCKKGNDKTQQPAAPDAQKAARP
jgi:hypothetical protein